MSRRRPTLRLCSREFIRPEANADVVPTPSRAISSTFHTAAELTPTHAEDAGPSGENLLLVTGPSAARGAGGIPGGVNAATCTRRTGDESILPSGLYAHRATCRDSYYRHSCSDPLSGLRPGPGEGAGDG